jgi:hypothetical protein
LFALAKPKSLERGTNGFPWLDSTSRFDRAICASVPIFTTANVFTSAFKELDPIPAGNVLQLTVVDRQGTSATFVLPLPNQL